MEKQKSLKEKGITLVALVVTIIILLILAGITIAQLTGNGLLEKTKFAKKFSKEKQIEEYDKLNKYENTIGQYINGNRDQALDSSTIINDFTIEIIKTTSINIKVKTSDVKTSNNTRVIGYIWFCNGKAAGVSEENEYLISGLNMKTKYTNIYAVAIDEYGAIKKSSNTLEETTNTTLELYNATTFRKDLFSSNYSDGTTASYTINSNGVMEVYGASNNRNFASFMFDLTNYKSAIIEWYNQSTTKTVGCVISKSKTNFYADTDIASSNGIVKYDYSSGPSFKTTTFDISDLNGTYYVGILGFESGYYGYIKSITLY